jgi:lipid II:glycine glycyltransferase (peptidoglycan interpeptide bridge formation enzyme)
MFAAGDLLFAHAADRAGRTHAITITYLLDGCGYFLHGARADDAAPGASHAAHWATVCALRAAGFRWYDLGQVPTCEPGDGLYRFKRSLGGHFVDFGREYRRVPAALRPAYGVFQAARRVLTRRAPRQ